MTVIGSNAIIHKRIESTEKFVPLTPSATSYGMGWKTLQAVHYREGPASGEFSLPPVSRHKLFLIIRPSERLELRSEGVRLDRPPAAGSIHVIPAGSSVLWRREGSRDALLIDLEPSLIARVAAEAFELDSSRTMPPPLYGLNVPELRSAMLAVDAELRASGQCTSTPQGP
jgi:AraC family transcriptional regulator